MSCLTLNNLPTDNSHFQNWCQTCASVMSFNLFANLCNITSSSSMCWARRITSMLTLTHVSLGQALWHRKTDFCGSHRLKFQLSHTYLYIVACVMATTFCNLTSVLFVLLSGDICVFTSCKSHFYCRVD